MHVGVFSSLDKWEKCWNNYYFQILDMLFRKDKITHLEITIFGWMNSKKRKK